MTIWPRPYEPRRTPRQPAPSSPPMPDVSPQTTHLAGSEADWLAERLFDHRVIALTGRLDPARVNHAASSLMLLDASGNDPVELRLTDVDADLDAALTLVDTVDVMGVPVHATCLGQLSGPAVAVLAVTDHRSAGPHASVWLREPRAEVTGPTTEVAAGAEHHRKRLRRLQERIAAACQRTVEQVGTDMQTGRFLTAQEARGYGLVDELTRARTRDG